ncbi:MAG TPA: Cro/CI family transcriptional regulator [Xanthobacteraceae bacterium]|nr:Cro/CI family transcriptional regulator [Xanthobacteraceae bacterium]
MRDPGLEQAIRAAGGVGALARKVGISQPSVSNWGRVPAERVMTVEAATGVHRAVLRPDLYRDAAPHAVASPGDSAVDDVDFARAQEYALLAVLLGRAPDADLIARLTTLRGDASPLGLAHAALAEAAAVATVEQVEREFFNLFIGIGRGELVPYGSYYLTGFLNERPLARLRADLKRLGIERAAGHIEPEDHPAVLCDIMAGLADGRFAAPPGADRTLFENHLAPWIGRFFADLETAQQAEFYRPVGTIGRLFMGVESEAFTLAA